MSANCLSSCAYTWWRLSAEIWIAVQSSTARTGAEREQEMESVCPNSSKDGHARRQCLGKIDDETGLTIEQAKAGVDALIGAGLPTAVGQPTHQRLVARAVI